MSQMLQIHPETPQPRLISQAVEVIEQGGVVVYPTDSGYALGCQLDEKQPVERIRRIRQLDDKHNFTLVCRDLSAIATYAKVDNIAYRAIKSHTPGPYTFVLHATNEVPRRLKQPKRKTIGIRVPDNLIAQTLLAAMTEPMMSVTLILPGDELPLLDPYEIRDLLENQVDLIIDGGYCGMEATSVIDLSNDEPTILREGAGSVEEFRL
ncbi:MAG: threonylcarbamoyl-AMP synthase [Cellvibrionales bacterium]|nr:threonylcarbamoyl-AMP synthase [Cellvibrionales bacterium]|tara:strand:+ start:807 stop:1430 length:624 start_codon:yes stop_codon:yes gene_type:complete